MFFVLRFIRVPYWGKNLFSLISSLLSYVTNTCLRPWSDGPKVRVEKKRLRHTETPSMKWRDPDSKEETFHLDYYLKRSTPKHF